MKKTILALMLTSIVGSANAAYTAVYNPDPKSIVFYKWALTTPIVGDWEKSGSISGCTNWTPATSTYNQGVLFTQTATDCKQTEIRTLKEQEKHTIKGTVRLTGQSSTENRIVSANSSRQATGTKPTISCTYNFGNYSWWRFTDKYGQVIRDDINYMSFYYNDKNYSLGDYVDYGGYRITRGAVQQSYIENGGYVYIHEICRTPL